MITLDGSFGEGGGQILRTALALSMLTQKPFVIEKIRENRPVPGLKAQHLAGINALQMLSESEAKGVEEGSRKIEFYPKQVSNFRATIDVGTAGPITLVLQSVLPPLMFAQKNSRIKIIGGTDVAWSPQIDYFASVILPQLQRFAEINIRIEKRGYYPKGGGKIDLTVKPKYNLALFDSFDAFQKRIVEDIASFDLAEQQSLLYIKGVSHASKDLIKAEVAERQARAARLALNKAEVPVFIRSEYSDTFSTGSGIALFAAFSKTDEVSSKNPVILGSDALGEKRKRSEQVGEEAAEKLLKEINSGAGADHHLADNLIPFLGILGGKIKTSSITGHILSNVYVAEKFLGVQFHADKDNCLIRLENSMFH